MNTTYHLPPSHYQQVKETLTKHRDGRVRSRAQMIYLLHLGKKVSEVAEMLLTTQATVYNWHKRWRQAGLAGLEEQARPGRPPLGGDKFKEKLETVLQTDPSDLGYGFAVWTIERLIQHMGQETGVYVSEGTMHNRLADLDFVYRRPKHTLENLQDKDAKKQADALLTELKKKAESGEIDLFFVDETTIRLLSTLVKCWMKRGHQKCIPTPGQNKWQHVIGALNWRTNELVYQVVEKKNSKTFCAFLEHLVANSDRKRPLFYVLDNASYHHSQVSHAMIAYFEDVAVPIWLPTYCSDLNPIERYWKHLKDNACANRLFSQVQEVVDSVVKVLDEQNDMTSTSRLVFQDIY